MLTLDDILNDPPQVHEGAPNGVWRANTDCYKFLADNITPETVSLETGLGVSTALLAQGASHTCIVPWQGEADALVAYMERTGQDVSHVDFLIGPSDLVLPTLDFMWPLDIYFIDGCHGFPSPIIDWYYGASWLRKGGLLILDDADLPAVHVLAEFFLWPDPRWTHIAGGPTWVAYRRESEGGLGEEWNMQAFL